MAQYQAAHAQEEQLQQQQKAAAAVAAATAAAAPAARGPQHQRPAAPVHEPSEAEKKSLEAIDEHRRKINDCVKELVKIQQVLEEKDLTRHTHQMTIERAREILVQLEFTIENITKQREQAIEQTKKAGEMHTSIAAEIEHLRQRIADLGRVDGSDRLLRVTSSLENNNDIINQKIAEIETRISRGESTGTSEKRLLQAISELRKSRPLLQEYDQILQERRNAGGDRADRSDRNSAQAMTSEIIRLRLQQATLMERIRTSIKGLDDNRFDLPQIMTQRYGLLLEIKKLSAAIREENQKIQDARVEDFKTRQKKREEEILASYTQRQEVFRQQEARRQEWNRHEEMKEVAIPCATEVSSCKVLIQYVEDALRQMPKGEKAKKQGVCHSFETLKLFEQVMVPPPLATEEFAGTLTSLKKQQVGYLTKMRDALFARKEQKAKLADTCHEALVKAKEEATTGGNAAQIASALAHAHVLVQEAQQGERTQPAQAAKTEPAAPALPQVVSAAVAYEQAHLQVTELEHEIAEASTYIEKLGVSPTPATASPLPTATSPTPEKKEEGEPAEAKQ
eukprot:TRINITY_DN431_c0_g2_i1.p1 TRINITY_DN431_c0_g2~~TRINITY_DN431_c0_g2_i1.p1  ORF type:complete len:663 (-),score=242.00 TRINITY_DN431_c0_g2_i1:106-1803(-)